MKLKSVVQLHSFSLTVIPLARLWSTFGSVKSEKRADETLLKSLSVQFFLHLSSPAGEKLAHQADVTFMSVHISRTSAGSRVGTTSRLTGSLRLCFPLPADGVLNASDVSAPHPLFNETNQRWSRAFSPSSYAARRSDNRLKRSSSERKIKNKDPVWVSKDGERKREKLCSQCRPEWDLCKMFISSTSSWEK